MTAFRDPEQCALCGNTVKRELRWALVKWLEAEPGMSYEHIARCVEEDYCRRRVIDNGETWPLAERKGTAA